MVDHLAPACARVLKQSGEVGPQQGIHRKANGDQGQRPAHAAARGFQQGQKQHSAKHHVHSIWVANAKGQPVKHIRDVEHAQGAAEGQQPIDQRNAAGVQHVVRGRALCVPLAACKHQKDQAKYKGQVHAPVRRLTQQAKARRVVVKAAQRNQQPLDDLQCWGHHGPKAHLRVKFFFQLLELFVVR